MKTCRACGEELPAYDQRRTRCRRCCKNRVVPADATCARPRCGQVIGEPVWARLREDVYCSTQCRDLETKRLIQERRRELPEQREYARRQKLMTKYGITPEEWEMLYDLQGGRCAICAVALSEVKTCVDHEHQTGRVRGLLCNVCNQGLGYFADDVARMERAIEYLKGAAAAADQGEEVTAQGDR